MAASVIHVPAGQDPEALEAGDFILCHRPGFISALIRWGQAIRFRGADRQYAHWSHAALVVSVHGDLVEALTAGVERSHVSKYRDIEYVLVRTNTVPLDQLQIIRFANAVVGFEYGFLTIGCIALGYLTASKITVGFTGQSICSGLVARARERAGAWFGKRLPEDTMPADLAKHYHVTHCTSDRGARDRDWPPGFSIDVVRRVS